MCDRKGMTTPVKQSGGTYSVFDYTACDRDGQRCINIFKSAMIFSF